MLIIHSVPVTLTWIPRDVTNEAFNLGGMLSVGTFETVEGAKQLAAEQYSVPVDGWSVSTTLPVDLSDGNATETHTLEIDGHRILRHGIGHR